jgi:hypothetical protein
MNSITKIIIGLVGFAAIGLLTYYVVIKKEEINEIEKPIVVNENPITIPLQDTIVKEKVIQDTIFDRIKKALSIDGEEFTPTEVEGVYTNSSKDKLLTINEDVWKKILRKAKIKFPNIAEDCNQKYEMTNLSEYKFVGLLTYLADSKNIKKTSAYTAIEIRNGNAKSFAAGDICCGCEGDPLVAQKVDAVIVK